MKRLSIVHVEETGFFGQNLFERSIASRRKGVRQQASFGDV
jgi:hypothetical protein